MVKLVKIINKDTFINVDLVKDKSPSSFIISKYDNITNSTTRYKVAYDKSSNNFYLLTDNNFLELFINANSIEKFITKVLSLPDYNIYLKVENS